MLLYFPMTFVSCDVDISVTYLSIRLMFSIADIQEEFENEEESEENPSYPIRCSFSFTKVRICI